MMEAPALISGDGVVDFITYPPLPATLYHYTTAAGLHGILSSGKLRATDCRFLNDSSEGDYAGVTILQLLEEVRKQLPDAGPSIENVILEELGEMAAVQQRKSPFVACFCEHDDLLSMWRGYGVKGAYCIGFDANRLRDSIFVDITLAPVDYGATRLRQGLVEWFTSILRNGREQFDARRGSFWVAFLLLLPLIKHPAFSEEKEWRMVAQRGVHELKFLPTDSTLKPYVELLLRIDRLPIKSITLGPTHHGEAEKSAVQDLLRELGYGTTVEVSVSGIPFRS